MSKPEDIPQDVWDAAVKFAGVPADDNGWHQSVDVFSSIARAILAAKAEERQQCINVVLGFIQYGGDTHHGVTVNPMADAMEVAKAIRERGKANVSTARKSEIEGV